MNDTVHTAHTLDRHRVAQLDRENELLRRHAAGRAPRGAPRRPSVASLVTALVGPRSRRSAAPASC
jgi:hypothetical protein